jgi:peptidyl-prolyl cis-trans isomerase C
LTAPSSGTGRIAGVLREPLLHFTLGGALLFAAYHYYAPTPPAAASHEILVTPTQVAAFRRDLLQMNGRPATDAELSALVQEYVDDEVLYREAIALGLDRGDLVVHRRMEQKMRFLIEDTAHLAPATDAELSAYLDAHREDFDEPARVRLSQVFVSGDLHGADDARLAAQLRGDLIARAVTPAQAGGIGDAFPAGFDFDLLSQRELVRYFGADFAAAVMTLPVGVWSQPIPSIHGLHLVWIREREPVRRATLEQVRERVQYAFDRERRDRANAARLDELRARYRVELPTEAAAAGAR